MKQMVLAAVFIICSAELLAGQQADNRAAPIVETLIETVTLPLGTQTTNSDLRLPQRGDSKQRVLETQGEPQEMVAAIGDPPISKWAYADFIVFFEQDLVLHAVVKRESPTSQ